MARKKVKLAFIPDEMARKNSYKKRKKSIIKKVSELATLCGIPVCAIISSPFDSKPEIWPDLDKAKEVIQMYQNIAVLERRNMNPESFIEHMISKAQNKMDKVRQLNREKELNKIIFKWMGDKTLPEGMTTEDLNGIYMLAEKIQKKISLQIEEENEAADLKIATLN